MTRPTAFAALIVAASLAACREAPRRGDAAAAPGEDKIALAFQEIVGRLKLVKEEYALAIREGAIIDPQEYEEADMFAEQAALRYRAVAGFAREKDPETHAAIERGLGDLMKTIAEKRPVEEAAALADRLLALVSEVNPRPVPPAVEGTRAAVAHADGHIAAEQQVDGYRIGLVVGAPRPLYLRQSGGGLAESAPAADSTHYLGVVLREGRTKRFLPAAEVTVRLPGGPPVRLTHLWSQFLQYGANIAAPEGSFEIEVAISPPAYCRHGDMLGAYVRPVSARFEARRNGVDFVVSGDRPAPAADDYTVGDDVLQALGESRWKGEAGPYSVLFVAEAPEPIWLWKDGKPVLDPVEEGDSSHLEIALMEKGSMRMVPEAKVRLTLAPEGGGSPIEVPLHPLLSSFYHYGNTVPLPDGSYRVTVHVGPPAFGALAPGVFEKPAETAFAWETPPRVASAAGGGMGG